jgi:hypothetical protein
VADAKFGVCEAESYGPRAPPLCAPRKSVLGILKKLEDKVRSVVISIGQKHWTNAANVRAIAKLVV